MASKQKRRDINILVILVIVLFVINYPFLDNSLKNLLNEEEEVFVNRIIDGDTIEAENRNESIRLLGINTPERGDFLYGEARDFLEGEILGKNVTLEFTKDRYDKYDRTLAYVFLNGKNINLELVENGFANYYFYEGKDKYSDDLTDAWGKCIEKNVNLCEKSANICAPCIDINSYSITNSCSFSCDIDGWIIKGEGREKFVFNGTLNPGMDFKFSLDLTNSGGSLFLRDEKGKLA
ncbi:MAG: thermonuclease family protein, partial [Candidatus Pacearchaeota archaeon]|nr:thermonuclease family protein [Candidatus Pacearchaeota archaeon]